VRNAGIGILVDSDFVDEELLPIIRSMRKRLFCQDVYDSIDYTDISAIRVHHSPSNI
jgi:hypothetical protein